MSSTNKTTNYNLSQFLGSDKPAWLVDYNSDMQAIDTQMKANADAATAAQTTANTADSKADTNAGAISTLNTQINGASGMAADVSTLQGNVNTINSLIGNGEPTTTDKTLIGAINELNSGLGDVNTALDDAFIPVSINADVVEISADGVKTYADMLNDLQSAFAQYLTTIDEHTRVEAVRVDMGSLRTLDTNGYVFTHSSTVGVLGYSHTSVSATDLVIDTISISANSSAFKRVDIALADGTVTVTDRGSAVPASGTIFKVKATTYKAL